MHSSYSTHTSIQQKLQAFIGAYNCINDICWNGAFSVNLSEFYKWSRGINRTLKTLNRVVLLLFFLFLIRESSRIKFKDFDAAKASENKKGQAHPKGKNSGTLCHVAPINYNAESCEPEKRSTLIRYRGSHVA